MTENDVASQVVDSAFQVHSALGPGLLESIYERALGAELSDRGLRHQAQISYRGRDLGEGFRADLIVEEKVIVELKSIEDVRPVHTKQLLTYLRMTRLKLGLLINFNVERIKNGITRVVNGLRD